LGPALRDFVQATDRQLQLIRGGQFEEARRLDFEEVSQQFDLLQHQLHKASNGEVRAAAAFVIRSRIEFAIAVLLVTVFVVILFLRTQRQKHLMFAKQAVLQQSEDRFRALTEKSTDIVFITNSAGIVNYVSPSIQTALAFSGEVISDRNLGDFVQPDDAAKFRTAMAVGEGENETIELHLSRYGWRRSTR
jgi:PAS domain-containing protein